MSVSKETTIWCDGCSEWEQSVLTAAEIRANLKRRGWVKRGNNDYCGTCA